MPVKRTEAQKEAEKRWQLKNPSTTLRTPQHIYDELKQAANELNTTHHGLINQILVEWLEHRKQNQG